jgi:hypothetical protein
MFLKLLRSVWQKKDQKGREDQGHQKSLIKTVELLRSLMWYLLSLSQLMNQLKDSKNPASLLVPHHREQNLKDLWRLYQKEAVSNHFEILWTKIWPSREPALSISRAKSLTQ